MKIWVDADACPVVIKEILFRAAERTAIDLILVANQPMPTPGSRYITSIQVSQGFDVADDEIVSRVTDGDLVITSDIPLAAEVIEKGKAVLSFRGESYTKAPLNNGIRSLVFSRFRNQGGRLQSCVRLSKTANAECGTD